METQQSLNKEQGAVPAAKCSYWIIQEYPGINGKPKCKKASNHKDFVITQETRMNDDAPDLVSSNDDVDQLKRTS